VSQVLAGKGISVMDDSPYSPDLAPADFWLFPELKGELKGKRFSDVEGKKRQTFLFRILQTVLNNGRSAGYVVKNWKGFDLKSSRLLICAALKS
jgi:hypothetical protein